MDQKRSIIILIVVILLILSICIYYVYGRSDQTTTQETSSGGENQSQESLTGFDTSKKEKPLTGEQHSILDMGLEYTSTYDRVTFSFTSSVANQTPGYIAELDGKVITIRFYDTREVDINLQKVYEGENKIIGEGKIIEKAELWYPPDDSSIGAKIYLKSAKGFKIQEEDLLLSLDVECGCSG